MHNILKSALICAASIVASITLTPTPAHAKQCIWNKGGYVMSVSWFRPSALVVVDPRRAIPSLSNIGAPVLTQRLTVGTGSCNDWDEELVAFISIADCMRFKVDGESWSCDSSMGVMIHPNVKTSDPSGTAGKVASISCSNSVSFSEFACSRFGR